MRKTVLALLFCSALVAWPASVKISDLPAGTPYTAVVFPGSYGTNTYKYTLGQIRDFSLVTVTQYYVSQITVTNIVTNMVVNTVTNVVDQATDYSINTLPDTGVANTYCITFAPSRERTNYLLQATGSPLDFNSTTNREAGKFKSAVVVIEAGGGDRVLTFNANWIWEGTTNNPPTQLNSGKVGILSIGCYGTTENKVVAAFVQQP